MHLYLKSLSTIFKYQCGILQGLNNKKTTSTEENYMAQKNSIVTVIGGSGFLGIYVVRRLAKLGVRIQVISRNASLKAAQLRVAGSVGQVVVIDCDATDFKNLEKHISKSNYVINLVGILFPSGKQNFNTIHHNLPSKVAELCKKHGIKKLVHISALGVDKNKRSNYATSKLAGEKGVLSNFPKATILRPSAMFGPEDNFFNMSNNIAKISPFLPLIGGGATKLQPVYVDDVARAVLACIDDKDGKVLELGGPKVYSLREIEEFILKTTHRKRLLLPIPIWLANIMATAFSLLPRPPLTVDQVKLLRSDNILASENGFAELGIKPTSMETVVPGYID